MGQESSQMADAKMVEHMARGSPSGSEIVVDHASSPRMDAAPKPSKKRRRRDYDDEEEGDVIPKKKKKRNGERSPKDKKSRRSVPQHLRGTDMKPSQETTAEEPSRKKKKKKSKTAKLAITESDAAFDDANPQKVALADEAEADQRSDISDTGLGMVEEGAHDELDEDMPDAEHDTIKVTDVVVDAVDEPTPRKKKRKKSKRAKDDVHQLAAEEDIEDDIVEGSDAPMQEQEMDAKIEVAATKASQQKDGIMANPIVKPGPPRKKKKKAKSTRLASAMEQKSLGQEAEEIQEAFHGGSPAGHAVGGAPVEPDVQLEEQHESEIMQEGEEDAPPADRMPTPPQSPEDEQDEGGQDDQQENNVNVAQHSSEHDEDYDPRVREGYIDASGQISSWLNSEESPAPPDQLSPVQAPTVQKRQARKRGRTGGVDAEDGDEYREEPEAESEAELDANAHADRKYGKPLAKQGGIDQRGLDTGRFTAEEKALADEVFERNWKRDFEKPWDLKVSLIDWQNVGNFKLEIYEAFPRRSLTAIRRFCQRRFTSYNTGPWTQKEDELLRQSYTKWPNEWVLISDLVEREPQACRDRWRGVLKNQDKLEKGPWGEEDEKSLIKAVEEHLKDIRAECLRHGFHPHPDREAILIKWKDIAACQALGGRKTERACREKWTKLRERYGHNVAEKYAQRPANTSAQPNYNRLSKKQKAVEKVFEKLGTGDIHNVLTEIYNTMQYFPDAVFRNESTLWSVVATKNPESKYPSALRRRVYYAALEQFAGESSSGSKTVGWLAFSMKDKLEQERDAKGLRWRYHFDVRVKDVDAITIPEDDDVVDEASASMAAAQRRQSVPTNRASAQETVAATGNAGRALQSAPRARSTSNRNTQGGPRNQLSNEYVYDSSDEGEDEAESNDAELSAIPETQEDEAVAGAERMREHAELDDDLPLSSIASEDARSLGRPFPRLSAGDFLRRCRDAGLRQNAQFSGARV